MQIYLLATHLFALAALLLGLSNFSGGRSGWRLLPLFLLVISRSLSLIVFLLAWESAQIDLFSGVLEIFSAFCLVWALLEFPPRWPAGWSAGAWAGIVAALLLVFCRCSQTGLSRPPCIV